MEKLSRRRALKQFVFVATGVTLVPSCLQDRSKSSLILKNISISREEESLLAELCETILPKTATPGAKDLSAHLFVLKMIDDCRSKEDQEKFIKGLAEFKEFCKRQSGKEFTTCNTEERAKLVADLVSRKEETVPVNDFFKMVKGYTIQAYASSEYFLTKVQVYELIPGRYHGCVQA